MLQYIALCDDGIVLAIFLYFHGLKLFLAENDYNDYLDFLETRIFLLRYFREPNDVSVEASTGE